MDTVEAVNTHCKKVNDFRDSKMLPSATPMKIIPEEWKGSNPIATPGGGQEMLIISEHGLYFFLGRSDKPKALPYQMWVAGDVANALGYVDTTQAIRMHCKKVNKFSYGDMPQGAQPYNIIPGEWKGVHRMHTPGGGGVREGTSSCFAGHPGNY